eukprot:gb/GECG01000654.1/.p1 GENE.gb/GECG01000654.1/~~gb/GECG01000654.1/.p1  ORF type:complete len:274 (+),score=37.82 gb/GECG01000654.1/:1-822(+)
MKVGQVKRDATAAFRREADGKHGQELRVPQIRNVLYMLTGSHPTEEEIHFMLQDLGADRDRVIGEEEFVDWFVNSVCGEQGQGYNPLLVKDRLGKPRPATCKLPPPDYTFGMKAGWEAEGVKAAVTQWDSREAAAPSDKPFEKDQSTMVHGIAVDRPSTPFKAIVENAYCHDPDRHERKYPRRTAASKKQEQKSQSTKKNTTLGNELRTISMFGRTAEHEESKAAGVNKLHDGWKMKKFEGVGRKVDSYKHANHEAYESLKERVGMKKTEEHQ